MSGLAQKPGLKATITMKGAVVFEGNGRATVCLDSDASLSPNTLCLTLAEDKVLLMQQ